MGDSSPKNLHKLKEQKHEVHDKKEHEKHDNADRQHHSPHHPSVEPEAADTKAVKAE